MKALGGDKILGSGHKFDEEALFLFNGIYSSGQESNQPKPKLTSLNVSGADPNTRILIKLQSLEILKAIMSS